MSKFIYKLIGFILPLFFLASVVGILVGKNHQFKPSSAYYYQDFKSAFKKGDFDIIAIGNSKSLSAIDKEVFEDNKELRVANLGYSSSNISVSKLTLESYLNQSSVIPKLILLEVSWFTFNDKRTHLHGIVGELFIRDVKLWKNYFNYDTAILFPKIKQAWKVGLKDLIRGFPQGEETSYAARFKTPSPDTIDYQFEVEEMEKLFPEFLAGIDDLLLNDFYSIVRICQQHQIDLILFTAPEDEVYSKFQKDITEVKNVFTTAANSNPNVYYLDYSLGGKFYQEKFKKWLSDSHHVNENTLFSKELLKDITNHSNSKIY